MSNYAVYRHYPDGRKEFIKIVRAECAEQAENKVRHQMRIGCYEAYKITDVIESAATAEGLARR